ncbi:UTP--glucose-1-phosphate uridylyltransferase, partial [Candidatus Parcubacteria bacterium]|nr:UTP--glucose-1-phosphate uridylyltransferase [Candidatus Parcubacteria bacterium]
QMIEVFKKYKKPLIALCKVEREKVSSYGVVEVEKIKGEKRVVKIKRLVEKPNPKEAPSNFVIVGRYILTPEVFQFLMRARRGKDGEIHLSEVFQEMISKEREILGYFFEGKWLECGNKISYLQSLIYLTLKHKVFGPQIKIWLKKFLI